MADAFISYSRKDKAFASALKTGLEADGFEILFDLEDILGSEDWARRLVDMIAAADHVVFVISPIMGLLKQNRGTFTELAMVGSANRVLAADATSVFAWPASGGPGTRLNPGDKLIEAAAFDPDGKYIATAHAWDYTVRLWHADGSGLARTLGAATASTETLRFSPDGKHLVVASKDETVQIWHMDTNTPAVLLRGQTSWVVDAQFSKDSARLVTTSYDGTSRVWNVDGSNEEIILNRSVYAARFDSTGSRIVTTSGNQVGVWSLDPARLQRALADRTRVCLDQSFRTRFLSEDDKIAAAGNAACRQQRQPE